MQKYIFLSLFLLSLYTFSCAPNNFFERKLSSTSYSESVSIKECAEKSQIAFSLVLEKFQIKARSVYRSLKFINADDFQPITWLIGNTRSSFKILFSLYDTSLFNKIPDARVYILASRAHPPTQS